MIVNADGQILGRMATHVVEQLQAGEEVHIINAEKCVVSGSRERVLNTYKERRDRGHKYYGPFFPKLPDRIIKRTVRNMLPDNAHGREQLKRLKAYIGVPQGMNEDDAVQFEEADKGRLKRKRYVRMADISEYLGADLPKAN